MESRSGLVILRGALMATLFVALWVWLASLVRRFDAAFGFTLPAGLRPVGWLLVATGLAIGASCVVLFLTRGRGTPAPFDPPQVFVASGPYRYVRNPMYVGAVLALTGGGLAFRSPAILALAALFWLLAHLMVVLVEEPGLAARFGDSFAAYRRRVRRWLPGPPREAP